MATQPIARCCLTLSTNVQIQKGKKNLSTQFQVATIPPSLYPWTLTAFTLPPCSEIPQIFFIKMTAKNVKDII